jgi:hypothetical protein
MAVTKTATTNVIMRIASQIIFSRSVPRCWPIIGGYAVMLNAHDKYRDWSVYDLEGRSQAAGRDTDREAARRLDWFAVGAIGTLRRMRTR